MLAYFRSLSGPGDTLPSHPDKARLDCPPVNSGQCEWEEECTTGLRALTMSPVLRRDAPTLWMMLQCLLAQPWELGLGTLSAA